MMNIFSSNHHPTAAPQHNVTTTTVLRKERANETKASSAHSKRILPGFAIPPEFKRDEQNAICRAAELDALEMVALQQEALNYTYQFPDKERIPL